MCVAYKALLTSAAKNYEYLHSEVMRRYALHLNVYKRCESQMHWYNRNRYDLKVKDLFVLEKAG